MTKLFEKVVNTKIKRVLETTASVLIISTMILSLIPLLKPSYAYGAEDAKVQSMWALTIGDEEILYVDSEESAKKVIKGIKNYYLSKKSKVVNVAFDKEVKIIEKRYQDHIELSRVKEAIEYICLGRKECQVYISKKGDIAGISMDSSASEETDDYKNSEKIVQYSVTPFLNVTTVENITTYKPVEYKTVYKRTDNLEIGKTKVAVSGENGKIAVVNQVTKNNGEIISKSQISSKLSEKPKTRVILKGTGDVEGKKGSTFSFAKGEDVAKFAKKFVGNPYRYGGTSLSRGADCSGFVLAVYDKFGVDLPHSATAQRYYGKGVSYSKAMPGDIVIYPGHAAIYIGNGKIVHAFNPSKGICITNARYDTILAVRRIFR
ncbi:MAG: NlpC/P60 family protein [Eubacteriales bacterium]|nr:NlpC/P60 family protein [Eubacteriales bacterium]